MAVGIVDFLEAVEVEIEKLDIRLFVAAVVDHAVQLRKETRAVAEPAQPVTQRLLPRRRLIRLQPVQRGRTDDEQDEEKRAGNAKRGKDHRPRLMKADISGQVRAPDEPRQHLT